MTKNTKRSSPAVATLASETLRNPNASATARSLAASVLAQANTGKQTGAEMEARAGRVLQSEKYSEETKALAGSVVSQSNQERGN
jgi:predicted TIM-barrel enzyme